MVKNINIDTEIRPNINNQSHKILLICTQQAQKNFNFSIFHVLQIQYFSVFFTVFCIVFLLYFSGILLFFFSNFLTIIHIKL